MAKKKLTVGKTGRSIRKRTMAERSVKKKSAPFKRVQPRMGRRVSTASSVESAVDLADAMTNVGRISLFGPSTRGEFRMMKRHGGM